MSRFARVTELVGEENKNRSLIHRLINEFGGTLFTIEAMNQILNWLVRISKNKIYQTILLWIRNLIPVTLTSYQIYSVVKDYKNQKIDVYNSKRSWLAQLLNVKDKSQLESWDALLGNEVLTWLLSKPSANDFIINKIFNDEGHEIKTIDLQNESKLILLMNALDRDFIIEMNISSVLQKNIVVSTSLWSSDLTYEDSIVIRNLIFKNFIQSFDVENNVILYEKIGLSTRPRRDCQHPINQFDIMSLVKEVKNTLKYDKKRAWGFVGLPGTGKTSIILKIENLIKEYPIIYGNPNSFKYEEDIPNFFSFVKILGKCIIVLEDLDSYELEEKNMRVGEFIDGLDSLKAQSSFVLLTSLNYVDKVNQTFLNRRGRIDEIKMIEIPQTDSEVKDVLTNKIHQEYKSCDVDVKNWKTVFDKILEYNFTQSDICEIIEKIKINDKELTCENILNGVEDVKKTINIFKGEKK